MPGQRPKSMQSCVARGVAIAVFCASTAMGSMVAAQSIVLEISKSGSTMDDDFKPTGLAIEGHARPFAHIGKVDIAFGVRAAFEDSNSLWIGAGLALNAPVGEVWVVEATLMPGYYDPGSGDFDLGHDLEFHSGIGLGYPIDEKTTVSVAVSHLSNGGIGERNPGRNSIALRVSHRF